MAMSGETCRPNHSQSSPTLEMIVVSDGRWTARRPWRKRAAPTPPARMVIMGGGGRRKKEGGRWESRGRPLFPELADEADLVDVAAEVFGGVDEGVGSGDFRRGVAAAALRRAHRSPVDGVGGVQGGPAVVGEALDHPAEGMWIVRRGAELGVAVAVWEWDAHGDAQPEPGAVDGVCREDGDRVRAFTARVPVQGLDGESFQRSAELVQRLADQVAGRFEEG